MVRGKVFLIGLVSLACLTVTGCGSNKTLTCTKTETVSGMESTQKAVMKFEKDNVTNLSMEMSFKVDEPSVLSIMKTALESQFSKYDDEVGVDTTISTKDDTLKVKIDVDTKKASDSIKDELDMASTKDTYDNTKSSLEKDGYTCK